MTSDALDAQRRSSRSEPSIPTRRRLCAGIALWPWREYFQRPQLSSKALASTQQIRGDDGFHMGNRMLSVQSQQADSAHHWQGTILR